MEVDRTIMLRRSSKRVIEVVDKILLFVVIYLSRRGVESLGRVLVD